MEKCWDDVYVYTDLYHLVTYLKFHRLPNNMLLIFSSALQHLRGCQTIGDPNRFGWCTTIENPSHFFMTLICIEAMQSFISRFIQYGLADPSWYTIPGWVWQGLASDWKRYDAKFDCAVILETEFHENNNTLFPTLTSTHVTEKSFL